MPLLDVDYVYKHIDIMAPGFIGVDGVKPPELLAVNRFGQVPALKHGEIGLTQSNVILRYLAGQAGQLDGATPLERLRVEEWLAFEAADLLRAFGGARANLKFLGGHREVVKGFQQEARDALTKLDRHPNGWGVPQSPEIDDGAVTARRHGAVGEEAARE